jgi:hypothetical protein
MKRSGEVANWRLYFPAAMREGEFNLEVQHRAEDFGRGAGASDYCGMLRQFWVEWGDYGFF